MERQWPLRILSVKMLLASYSWVLALVLWHPIFLEELPGITAPVIPWRTLRCQVGAPEQESTMGNSRLAACVLPGVPQPPPAAAVDLLTLIQILHKTIRNSIPTMPETQQNSAIPFFFYPR